MGLDVRQVRNEIIVPTLMYMAAETDLRGRIDHPAAVELLLGTAACESRFRYVRQVGGGPALGIYQMEPATHRDILTRVRGPCRQFLVDERLLGCAEQMVGDLYAATVFARLLYWLRPEPLPAVGDRDAQGRYYKQWYNSSLGKGSRSRYVRHWNELVAPA